jgi:predicted Zn-dependent protease
LFEENPTTTRYGMRLAHAYQSINKVAETRDVLSKLKNVQHGRESISMRIMEGNLLLIENRPKDAMELFEQIEKDMPNVGRVNMQLGRCYLALKKWKKAEVAFVKELEYDPGNASAHHGLGVTFLRRKIMMRLLIVS